MSTKIANDSSSNKQATSAVMIIPENNDDDNTTKFKHVDIGHSTSLYSQYNTLGRYIAGVFVILAFWLLLGIGIIIVLKTFLYPYIFGKSSNSTTTYTPTMDWNITYVEGNATYTEWNNIYETSTTFETAAYATDTMTTNNAAPIQFLMTFLPFLPLLLGIWITVRFIHHRPLRTLITVSSSIHWCRVLLGFIVCTFSIGIVTVAHYIINKASYNLPTGLSVSNLIICMGMALVLIPIQTTSEELLFRGYLMQFSNTIWRNPVFTCITTSLIFMAFHSFNFIGTATLLEALQVLPYYLIMGLAYSIASIITGGTELAIGAHMANNFFSILILRYIHFDQIKPTSVDLVFLYSYGTISSVIHVVLAIALHFIQKRRAIAVVRCNTTLAYISGKHNEIDTSVVHIEKS